MGEVQYGCDKSFKVCYDIDRENVFKVVWDIVDINKD